MRKDKLLNLRVPVETHLRWKLSADSEGRSLSAWIRDACDERAAGVSVVRDAVYAPFVPSSGPSRVMDEDGVVHVVPSVVTPAVVPTVLGPARPVVQNVRRSPADCPRAHFHRKGTWCKECDFSG